MSVKESDKGRENGSGSKFSKKDFLNVENGL